MVDVKRASRIQRREDVPNEEYSVERKRAADWIEEHVLEAGKWPMQMNEIAEQTKWSRQHIANTVEAFFEPVFSLQEIAVEGHLEEFDSVFEAYRVGYQDGYADGREDALNENDS